MSCYSIRQHSTYSKSKKTQVPNKAKIIVTVLYLITANIKLYINLFIEGSPLVRLDDPTSHVYLP